MWSGLKKALAGVQNREDVAAMGVSAMMHGYLAFDTSWNLLVPFRTWQNTITGQAADEFTALLGFNIPQRWSIAHLYQAILNGEPHVKEIARITTLAGYVHHALTGENVLGVGDASGKRPTPGRCTPSSIRKACSAPVTVTETAGEGAPYGMALLAAYLMQKAEGETLGAYLQSRVFAGAKSSTLSPEQADVDGFNAYIQRFRAALDVEKAAIERL